MAHQDHNLLFRVTRLLSLCINHIHLSTCVISQFLKLLYILVLTIPSRKYWFDINSVGSTSYMYSHPLHFPLPSSLPYFHLFVYVTHLSFYPPIPFYFPTAEGLHSLDVGIVSWSHWGDQVTADCSWYQYQPSQRKSVPPNPALSRSCGMGVRGIYLPLSLTLTLAMTTKA